MALENKSYGHPCFIKYVSQYSYDLTHLKVKEFNSFVPVCGFQASAGKNVFLHHKQSVLYPCHPYPTSQLQADFS